jgi:hypothetical protein
MIYWLAYFIINGCDSIVVARTTPTQRWRNHAERLMSVLNLASSNSALAREVMDDKFERNMKKYNNIASVRKMAETLEASEARAPIPIPTHAATLDVVAATSAVDLPPDTLDAVGSSAVVFADASADASMLDFVDATSSIGGKTHERALYILMRIMCMHSIMLPLVF